MTWTWCIIGYLSEAGYPLFMNELINLLPQPPPDIPGTFKGYIIQLGMGRGGGGEGHTDLR